MQALPSNEGTTNPAPGTYNEDQNSVIAIQALPTSGNHFTGWTGNVAQPSNPSTTVTMSQAQTVTANFAIGAPSADLQVTVNDGKSAAVAGANNTYTIVVSNAGPTYVTGVVIKDRSRLPLRESLLGRRKPAAQPDSRHRQRKYQKYSDDAAG